jgi:UDP:flavonoid glycosyltransferase YjiC (YdhE family)
MPIPPNVVMTGPLSKRGSAIQLSALEKKDPSLYAWMNDAQSKGEDIIYLSLGSMCLWFEWSVKAMYYGIKDIPNCRVIWSIKTEAAKFLPADLDESKFFISSWLPQVELLCHPSVKAGLTHCGWGGTLEFISSGIPMVCFPHFGD